MIENWLQRSAALLLGIWLGTTTTATMASPPDYPQPDQPQSQWWDEEWWDEGRLPASRHYRVVEKEESFERDGFEFPLLIARPDDGGRYPAVLFLHGRRGLDDLVRRHVRRVAAQGFVVAAPDLYSGRFIEKFPIEHDYLLEGDAAAALDHLLARSDIDGSRACIYSHTRGGYYALKVAVSEGRQGRDVACLVAYYPHLQDPNAPEPMQVYRYAGEIDRLTVPLLAFIGEREQYQRRRSIETAILALQQAGREAILFTYPGTGRGFDFRPQRVRTLADDLAAMDAMRRASAFMRKKLTPELSQPPATSLPR
jgi:carboxymethylenebutenolidase